MSEEFLNPAEAKMLEYGDNVPKWLQDEYDMYEQVYEATKTIARATNCLGRNMADVANVMLSYIGRDHRTIQQSTISVFINLLIGYSKQSFDPRNEYSVKVCKAIVESLEKEGFMYNDKYLSPMV